MDTSKKIIKGAVNGRGFTITSAITQWDYGWQFIPEIEDLPATYRLDFSNEEKHGTALPVYCSTEGAEVPTELIDTGKDVWVWFVRIGDGFGITEYKWRVPNKCKPKTEQDEPTPSQQSSIDQAIARSNEAVEQAEQSASDASTSAQNASADAERAEEARTDAQNYATQAETARDNAVTAKTAAETAQGKAEDAQAAAESVAESIPSDYSQLSEDVSDLKEDLNNSLETVEKAKKDRVYLDGTITSGAWKQNNLNEYSSTQALFLSAEVIGGAKYYISGVSINTSFPLAIFVDENNTKIDTLYTSDNDVSVDREITTPDNCARIYINGRKWRLISNYCYPSIYRIAYDTDVLDEIASDIKDKQSISYAWTDAETEVVEHAFVTITSGNIVIRANTTTSDGYTYHKLAYDNTKLYRFYGVCNEPTVPAVICCDENDNIITVFGNTAGTVYKGEILADIPKNTKRIYSNGLFRFHKVEVAHERDVKSLVSEKIGVAFGDSITQGANTYIRNDITPYQDYPSVASELLGCKIYNGGLGGGTYSAGRSIDFVNVANCVVTGDYTSIIEGIDQYSLNQSAKVQYADIATLDFNKVDFITLSYGTNDWNFGRTIAEITTAMVNGISAILTAYPHLRIYVFTPIFRFNIGGSGQNSDVYVNPTSGLTLPQVCESIKTCANDLCLPCKDMYHESNINPYTKVLYMGDDTHPNANGYAVMGEKVARFINSH